MQSINQSVNISPRTIPENCTCCGKIFDTSEIKFFELGTCDSCDDSMEEKIDLWVNKYIDGAVKSLEAKGGQKELIEKIKSMTPERKEKLAMKLASK